MINPIISTKLHQATEMIGDKVIHNANLGKFNKHIEANGISLATTAFVAIVSSCVLIPRLITARDADERREIFTRDFLTVLTMLFAMKGLKGGLSNLVSKKKGLILTSVEKPLKDLNPIQKFIEYFKPIGGVSALSSRQLASKYTNISDKNTFVNFLKYVDENGGNATKALTVDKNNGKKLTDAAKLVFGENVQEMKSKTIVKMAEMLDEKELKPILDILKENKNPLVTTVKRVNAWLEAMALGIVVGFLGFGLPEANRRITNKKYENIQNNDEFVKTQPQIPHTIKITQNEQEVFKNFM